MSYIGNQVTSVPHIVDVFSGDGGTLTFGPMIRSPAGIAAIAVFISGSYKTPGIDYTLSGSLINFTAAPASGTSNIVIHHLGNGTSSQVPSDGSVTAIKLSDASVIGPKLAINSVGANNFSTSANSKFFSSGAVGALIFGG